MAPKERSQPADAGKIRASTRLGVAVGLAIAAMIAAIYIAAWLRGGRPAGHPWTGLMWSMISYMTLRSSLRGFRMPTLVYWVTALAAAVGGAIWAWTTFGVTGV